MNGPSEALLSTAEGRPVRRPSRAARRIGIGALAALVATGSLAMAPGATASPSGPAISVIVRAEPGAAAAAEDAVTDLGGSVARQLGIIGGFEAEVPADALTTLSAAPGVAAVTPNAEVRMQSVDPTLGYDTATEMGALNNVNDVINADDAHRQGITGAGVDVALIDTGVVPVEGLTAPGKIVNGPDLSFDSQVPGMQYLDAYGHGTHMAGIIGGRDTAGGGFEGVAPGVRILNVKVGAADGATDVSQVLAALDWVVAHRYDGGGNLRVINLSFGTDAIQDYRLDPLAYAAEVAWRKGIVVVVAAGNDGKQTKTLSNPAMDPYVIAVSASDSMGTLDRGDDRVPDFANRGTAARSADVVAPGRSIISLRSPGSFADVSYGATGRVGDRFFRGTGTSQAAAVVTGAAALLLQQRPELTPDQVKAILKGSATKLSGNTVAQGSGLVDVAAALSAPTPTNVTQTWPVSTGLGSLDAARGNVRVAMDGVVLAGEQDIMGRKFLSSKWAGSSWSGSSWSGGRWNNSTWTGSSWSGTSWAGSSWSGSSWSGSSWSGSSWSGSSWSGSSWSGSSWSGSSWSGSSWSGSSWSGSSWSGSSWSSDGWLGSTWT